MGARGTPPNFAEKTFADGSKTAKVFSLESFQLYGMCLWMLCHCLQLISLVLGTWYQTKSSLPATIEETLLRPRNSSILFAHERFYRNVGFKQPLLCGQVLQLSPTRQLLSISLTKSGIYNDFALIQCLCLLIILGRT